MRDNEGTRKVLAMRERRNAILGVALLLLGVGPLSAESVRDLRSASREMFEGSGDTLELDAQSSMAAAAVADGTSVEIGGAGLEIWLQHWSAAGSHRVGVDYRLCGGDRIVLQVRANRDVYLVALSRAVSMAGETGDWGLMHSRHGKAIRQRAGEVVSIPRTPVTLEDAPFSREIIVMVAAEPFDLSQQMTPRVRSASGAGTEEAKTPTLEWRLAKGRRNVALHRSSEGFPETYAFQIDGAEEATIDLRIDQQACARRVTLARRALEEKAE